MNRFTSFAALLAVIFLTLHVPYLPSTLDDLDSINFALGVHQFDVARHQPHPPGYPLYIAAGRISRTLIASDARALAALSALSAALGVFAIATLFVALGCGSGRLWAAAATALAVTSPLYWFSAVRPLSDAVGLAAAVAVQAAIIAATTNRALSVSAFFAGLAAGIRSQVFWLTAPLLFAIGTEAQWPAVLHARAGGLRCEVREADRGYFIVPLVSYIAGVTCWFVPLVAVSGGPTAYWRALFSQGSEDLTGIRMLWTTPTLRELLDALYYAFVAPWATWPIAVVVLAFAVVGVARLARRDPRALELIAIAFAPYLVFDILFQETFTIRYALPLVVPVAGLAAAGMRALPQYPALLFVVLVTMYDAHVGGRSIAAYSRQPAPAFRMLGDMRTMSASLASPPVLAADRRQMFDLRRPLAWLSDQAPRFERQLAAPPQYEWLEAVNYWNNGGRAPVWFVVDPRRAAIDLVQHAGPSQYRWSLPQSILMSGTRPSDVDWYTVDRPDWYVGEGWALTPEAAGVSEAGRRGLHAGGIEGWVNHTVFGGGAIVVGGRNFDPVERPRVVVSADHARWSRTLQVGPGGFFDIVRLPSMDFDVTVPEYFKLTISASPPSRVAVEQFDASKTRGVLAFGDGWHESEYDPTSGLRWRWLSDRAELRYLTAAGDWNLHLEGESPRKYYRRDSHIVFRESGTLLRELVVSDDFNVDIPVSPAYFSPSTLTIETDQTHVPAETSWRGSPDRRKLGLRIFKCELRPR